MDTPADRLRYARKRAGFTDAKASAKAFGWGYEAYKKHESGQNGLRADVAAAYAAAFGVSPEWLLFGGSLPNSAGGGSVSQFRFLPLLSMSEVSSVSGTAKRPARKTAVDAGQDLGPKAICVEIEDASMVAAPGSGPDSFAPGDQVAIDPDKPVRPGDYVVFEYAATGVCVLRRIRAHAQGNFPFDLVPLNPAWATETITSSEQGRIRGRVVRHIRVFS